MIDLNQIASIPSSYKIHDSINEMHRSFDSQNFKWEAKWLKHRL